MRMDRNLSAIYWAIAIIGLFGYSRCHWGKPGLNGPRKTLGAAPGRLSHRRHRMVSGDPGLLYHGNTRLGTRHRHLFRRRLPPINGMLVDQLPAGQEVLCILLPQHYLLALAPDRRRRCHSRHTRQPALARRSTVPDGLRRSDIKPENGWRCVRSASSAGIEVALRISKDPIA